jgi:hypothetical protein
MTTLNLFKSFRLTWWQAGLFKLGMLALGISIGATWHGTFQASIPALLAFAALSLGWVTFTWLRQP